MKTTEWKDTEIGRIPKDWEVRPLEEIGIFSKGSGVSRDQSHSGNLPCIRYGEIYTSHNNYIREFYSYISPEIAKQAKRLKNGDILFAGSGETKEEIGKTVAFVGNEEAYAGGDIIVLSPNVNCSSIFLGFVLNAPSSVRQKAGIGQGDAVVHIHKESLAKVFIPFPPKEEQQRIANALSDIDMLIASLDKAIEKKRLVKQGAMQQLLTGKKRLKGFTGEWKEICLGEIGKVTSAGVDKTIKENEQPVRLVNFLDVYHRDYIRSRDLHHWVTASDNKVLSCDVKKGDIFLTPSSEMPDDIGRFAVAIEDIPDACYSYHVNRLRPAIKLDLQYSAFMLNTKEYQDQITTLSEGSGKRYVISKSKFEKVKIHIPMDLREQNAIGYVLTSITSEIDSLIHEHEKYLRLKDGMMQELLTGKTRLI